MDIRKIADRVGLEKALHGRESRLVLFYSEYCPFCTSFMPHFEKAAQRAPELFLKACVDGSDSLDDLFSVEVVPTVLCFTGDKLSKRLDGRLGRGLTQADLEAFTAACLAGGEGK